MSGFRQTSTPGWLRYFAASGYPDVEPLAAGVEGAVYRLGDGTVAKVWADRSGPDLVDLQRCYADVAAAGLPFATPVIDAVAEVEGRAVTFERELPGEPLQRRLRFEDRTLDPAMIDCLTGVLRALAGVPGTTAMRRLAALGEDRPLWAGASGFGDALVSLLRRRVRRSGTLLRAHVPDFDLRFARLVGRLAALAPVAPTVVHGDLYGENILVDGAVRATAVLDFGFLTTAGDPRLDTAVSASIMNMYGPHAAGITGDLTVHLADALGYPADVLVLYQTAYAVATSNAFTDDGSDGHFPWCVSLLTRPEADAVLGLPERG